LLASEALLYTVPFALAVLRSLESRSFIAWLLKKGEYEGLEDFMRKAINEGLVRQLGLAMGDLTGHASSEVARTNGSLEIARKFAVFGTRVGRYAATHKDPEGVMVAMDYLTAITRYCTEKIFRAAADVFNESVRELETAAEEALGLMGKITSALAELAEKAGDNYRRIAEVKAEGKEENLRRAVDAYARALSFFTVQSYPLRHANLQNSLGVARGNLAGVREKEANLHKATAAFNEALRVYTFDAFPQNYALIADSDDGDG
jgi:hypothetical protein